MSNARTLASTINSNSEIVVPSGGIAFTDATNPNTVTNQSNLIEQDGYETGSWTPSVGGTATYNSDNYGRYVKIGDVVTVQFHLSIDSIGTGSQYRLSGLPFTSENISNIQTGCVSYWQDLAVNTIFLSFYVENSLTTVQFVGKSTSGNSVDNSIFLFQSNARVYGSATYRTA